MRRVGATMTSKLHSELRDARQAVEKEVAEGDDGTAYFIGYLTGRAGMSAREYHDILDVVRGKRVGHRRMAKARQQQEKHVERD